MNCLRLNRRPAPRRAMTLVEIVLALGLTLLIFAAITSGIYIYLFTLTRQQAELEQQQVVRSVVQMISQDLRAAMQYKPADVSGLANLSLTDALMNGSGLGGLGGSSGEGGSGTDEDSGETQDPPAGGDMGSSSGSAADQEGSESASYRPMLVGNSAMISVDISRLPRVDQYHSLMTGGDLGSQTPSDLKSIAFFLAQGEGGATAEDFDPEIAALGGLYRRQIDRAVAAFRGEYGPPSSLDEYCQLIAPEIVQVEFRYFDGSQWVSEWDSETMGGFPTAIEVTLGFDPTRLLERSQARSRDPVPSVEPGSVRLYRQVIHLPLSEVSS